MSEPEPEDLELLRSFVNTAELDKDTDQLDSPELLYDWLVERSLIAEDATIDEQAHRETLEFREAVRALALANSTGELDPVAITTLNRITDKVQLSVLIRSDGSAQLDATGEGLHKTFGRLFSIMYTAMVDGSFRRLKGCANDTCRWVYYDQSKNRSKKWCDMQTCGNVINARAYRQRHRDETPGPSSNEKSQ
jgi:predicted RNA-binding Zn ribbon-like protein